MEKLQKTNAQKSWLRAGLLVTAAGLILFVFVLLFGCGAAGSTNSAGQSSSSMAIADDATAEMGTADMGAPNTGGAEQSLPAAGVGEENGVMIPADPERKLIWTVYNEMETLEFDETLTAIEQLVGEMGGYIERSSVEGMQGAAEESSSRQNRYASLTIRVPQEKLNEFLSKTEGVGTVVYQNRSSTDITLQYTDLEARLSTLQTEQERLLSLLEEAADLDSIIKLEERLSSVRYEIESITSSLRVYDSQVQYSTVHLDLREVQRIRPVDDSIGEQIKTGFAGTLEDIAYFAKESVVFVVVNLPYLLLLAIVAVVVLVIVRKRLRKAKNDGQKPTPPDIGKDQKES